MRRLVLLLLVLLLLAGCFPPRLPEPLLVTRSVLAPAAADVSDVDSAVINVVCVGDCVLGGGPSWVTSDTRVAWSHENPAAVDYYEVYRADMEPYFELATCVTCEAVTTTALETVIEDAPRGFNPAGGTVGAELWSEFVTFRVRACNAGGCSAPSNEIGSFNYSLLQGFPLDMP